MAVGKRRKMTKACTVDRLITVELNLYILVRFYVLTAVILTPSQLKSKDVKQSLYRPQQAPGVPAG
jgi:hypothetical protein